MATILSPAVLTREIDLSFIAPSVATTIVGMTGTANKGPINTPTLVTTPKQFLDTFGAPSSSSYGSHSAILFLQAANLLYYNRVASFRGSDPVSFASTDAPASLTSIAITTPSSLNGRKLLFAFGSDQQEVEFLNVSTLSDVVDQINVAFQNFVPRLGFAEVVPTNKVMISSEAVGPDASIEVMISGPSANAIFGFTTGQTVSGSKTVAVLEGNTPPQLLSTLGPFTFATPPGISTVFKPVAGTSIGDMLTTAGEHAKLYSYGFHDIGLSGAVAGTDNFDEYSRFNPSSTTAVSYQPTRHTKAFRVHTVAAGPFVAGGTVTSGAKSGVIRAYFEGTGGTVGILFVDQTAGVAFAPADALTSGGTTATLGTVYFDNVLDVLDPVNESLTSIDAGVTDGALFLSVTGAGATFPNMTIDVEAYKDRERTELVARALSVSDGVPVMQITEAVAPVVGEVLTAQGSGATAVVLRRYTSGLNVLLKVFPISGSFFATDVLDGSISGVASATLTASVQTVLTFTGLAGAVAVGDTITGNVTGATAVLDQILSNVGGALRVLATPSNAISFTAADIAATFTSGGTAAFGAYAVPSNNVTLTPVASSGVTLSVWLRPFMGIPAEEVSDVEVVLNGLVFTNDTLNFNYLDTDKTYKKAKATAIDSILSQTSINSVRNRIRDNMSPSLNHTLRPVAGEILNMTVDLTSFDAATDNPSSAIGRQVLDQYDLTIDAGVVSQLNLSSGNLSFYLESVAVGANSFFRISVYADPTFTTLMAQSALSSMTVSGSGNYETMTLVEVGNSGVSGTVRIRDAAGAVWNNAVTYPLMDVLSTFGKGSMLAMIDSTGSALLVGVSTNELTTISSAANVEVLVLRGDWPFSRHDDLLVLHSGALDYQTGEFVTQGAATGYVTGTRGDTGLLVKRTSVGAFAGAANITGHISGVVRQVQSVTGFDGQLTKIDTHTVDASASQNIPMGIVKNVERQVVLFSPYAGPRFDVDGATVLKSLEVTTANNSLGFSLGDLASGTGDPKFEISWTNQDRDTDTILVDLNDHVRRVHSKNLFVLSGASSASIQRAFLWNTVTQIDTGGTGMLISVLPAATWLVDAIIIDEFNSDGVLTEAEVLTAFPVGNDSEFDDGSGITLDEKVVNPWSQEMVTVGGFRAVVSEKTANASLFDASHFCWVGATVNTDEWKVGDKLTFGTNGEAVIIDIDVDAETIPGPATASRFFVVQTAGSVTPRNPISTINNSWSPTVALSFTNVRLGTAMTLYASDVYDDFQSGFMAPRAGEGTFVAFGDPIDATKNGGTNSLRSWTFSPDASAGQGDFTFSFSTELVGPIAVNFDRRVQKAVFASSVSGLWNDDDTIAQVSTGATGTLLWVDPSDRKTVYITVDDDSDLFAVGAMVVDGASETPTSISSTLAYPHSSLASEASELLNANWKKITGLTSSISSATLYWRFDLSVPNDWVVGGNITQAVTLAAGTIEFIAGDKSFILVKQTSVADFNATDDLTSESVVSSPTNGGGLVSMTGVSVGADKTFIVNGTNTTLGNSGASTFSGFDQAVTVTGTDAEAFPLTFWASSPGTWANDSIEVKIAAESTLLGYGDNAFKVDVYVNDAQQESYRGVSLDIDSDRYIEKLIGTFDEPKSEFVTTSHDTTISSSLRLKSTDTNYTVVLDGGKDGISGLTDSDIVGVASTTQVIGPISQTGPTGLKAFENKETTFINLLVAPGFSGSAVVQELIRIPEARQDCMSLLDPPFGLDNLDVVDWSNGVGGHGNTAALNSSFAATYGTWLKYLDSFNNIEIWLPPSSFILPVIAFNDRVAEVWSAPAGLNRGKVRSALTVYNSPTQGERDFMYSNGNAVNPIVNFQQDGIVVWGQRTLQRQPSALDRINVRRLVLIARRIVEIAAKSFLFDPNDPESRGRLVKTISPVLDDIARKKGLTSFSVADVTTSRDEDLNQAVIQVTLKPTRTMEGIDIPFVIQ